MLNHSCTKWIRYAGRSKTGIYFREDIRDSSFTSCKFCLNKQILSNCTSSYLCCVWFPRLWNRALVASGCVRRQIWGGWRGLRFWGSGRGESGARGAGEASHWLLLLICSFLGGPPAGSAFVRVCGCTGGGPHPPAHRVLLISHICSASALCQYLIRWTPASGIRGASTAICWWGQSNRNLMIRSAWMN